MSQTTAMIHVQVWTVCIICFVDATNGFVLSTPHSSQDSHTELFESPWPGAIHHDRNRRCWPAPRYTPPTTFQQSHLKHPLRLSRPRRWAPTRKAGEHLYTVLVSVYSPLSRGRLDSHGTTAKERIQLPGGNEAKCCSFGCDAGG